MQSLLASVDALIRPLWNHWGLLVILFPVLLGGGYVLIKTLFVSYNLSNRYEEARRLLKGIGNNSDPSSKLVAVRQALSGDDELKKRFEHFAATLSERDEDQFTTLEPHVFFNSVVLVEHPLDHEFLKHVPGMLTAGGIIGTFWGLISGLSAMNDGRPLQTAILALLGDVSSAFICSFLAVSLAVAVTFVERRNVTKLNRIISGIQDELSRLFHRSVAERTLDQMVVTLREQTDILKHTLDDLRSGVVDAVQSIPTEQERQMAALTAALTAQQQDLIATFSSAVTEGLQPALLSLNGTIARIAEAQSASQEKSLQGLIETFGEMLQKKTGTQFDRAADTIQTVGNDMKQAIEALKSFPEELSNRQREFIQDIQIARQATSKAAEDRETKLLALMETMTTSLNEVTVRSVNKIALDLGNEVTSLSTQLRALAADAKDQQASVLDDMMKSLQAGQNQFATNLEEASNRREVRSNELLEELAGRLQHSTSGIVEATRGLIEQMERQDARMRTELDTFATAIGQGHKEWVLQQSGLLEGQKQLLSEHGKLLDNFDLRLDKHAGVTVSLAESARIFGHSSQSLSSTVSGLQGVSGALESLASNITNQVTHLAQTVTTTRDLAQTLTSQIKEHGVYIGNIDQQVARLFETTAKGLGDLGAQLDRYLTQYNEKTGTQLGKYLGEIDTKLGQAVSRLGSSIGDLDEHLDSLNEVLATTGRKG